MELLKARKELLQSTRGKAVVKKYNRIALVLTEYELVHYQSWTSIIDSTSNNLQVKNTSNNLPITNTLPVYQGLISGHNLLAATTNIFSLSSLSSRFKSNVYWVSYE